MPQTVLVVDDDVTRLGLTVAMIEECGMVGMGTGDGDRARILIADHARDISIVITDVRMPGCMDGLALARWIRENWPHIRVVVTSGFNPDPKTELPEGVLFVPKLWLSLDVMKFVLHPRHGSGAL